MDETARKMLPYNKEYELKEGKYPEKMQEIAAGRAFFSEMGYDDVKVGGIIELVYIVLQSVVKPGITGFFKIDLHIKCYIYLS